jgi:hypothetical protein
MQHTGNQQVTQSFWRGGGPHTPEHWCQDRLTCAQESEASTKVAAAHGFALVTRCGSGKCNFGNLERFRAKALAK